MFLRRRTSLVVGLVLALGLLGTAAVVPSLAQPTITLELLTPRSHFTDAVSGQIKVKLDGKATKVVNMKDPSLIVMAKGTVQPGAVFPWHTHAGPVVVNVAQGELVFVNADECLERPYEAGEAFIDVGHGHVHTAFNRSTSTVDAIFYALFYEAPPTGPLAITEGVTPPTDCVIEP
jgi:quercetin dioxygenase-like cupin family protein